MVSSFLQDIFLFDCLFNIYYFVCRYEWVNSSYTWNFILSLLFALYRMGSHLYHYGEIVKWWNRDMVKWWYCRMIGMCEYGFGMKWCNVFLVFLLVQCWIWWNGEIIIWCNGDMVKFSNGESVFLGHISINGEMVKSEKLKCNFLLGVNFFVGAKISPWEVVLGRKFCWGKFCLSGQLYRGTCPRVFSREFSSPQDNTWQHFTHYWGTIFPGICTEVSWYLCTYDDTYSISLYTKLCVCYGMFLYIFLQYIPVDYINMSQGILALCGTICRSSFIFGNGRLKMSEQTPSWHRAKTNVRHVFMFSSDQY